ncbi:right-handed parallel beta-helix repeat-containing protein [Hyphococcus lacteus]|uniref:Right-handed parallel beta-helix repeat-containing protein n=1 Tax=Hyphococcus lacteus TaxID=3143536 RepID=A0ABV3Z2T3_9PROT
MRHTKMNHFALTSAKSVTVAIVAIGMTFGQVGAQSGGTLGGFPINEPGAGKSHSGGDSGSKSRKKGPMQIIVDVNGPGPYKTISHAIKDVAEGGVVYVMHGTYNESISLEKSVFIQGDRGPGSGVEISAPMNESCLKFAPKDGTAHAVVANVQFAAKINSAASACIDIDQGVFTLKESDVLGSGVRPAVKINGGTVMLEKNRISAGSEGVSVVQQHSLSQSFIIDNKILQNKVGVDIASGSRADVVIAGNEIFDNLDSGVKSSGYGAAKLIGNKIRNNKGSGIILDKYAKLSLVRYNEIAQNNGDGVAVPFGVNGVIEDNDIVGNDGLSIFIREGLEPKVTNNFIENNGGDKCSKKDRRKNRC